MREHDSEQVTVEFASTNELLCICKSSSTFSLHHVYNMLGYSTVLRNPNVRISVLTARATCLLPSQILSERIEFIAYLTANFSDFK